MVKKIIGVILLVPILTLSAFVVWKACTTMSASDFAPLLLLYAVIGLAALGIKLLTK